MPRYMMMGLKQLSVGRLRLRQPEYTGRNRCVPCTIVNLLIAVIITGGVAVVSIPLGGALFVVSLGAIYFRGYLVPGTQI